MKLDTPHKHIMTLIDMDADSDGWCSVSEKLYPTLKKGMPSELMEFEKCDGGYRAKLTDEGKNVLYAMEWL